MRKLVALIALVAIGALAAAPASGAWVKAYGGGNIQPCPGPTSY